MVEALGRVVTFERLPEALGLADLDSQAAECGPVKILVGGELLANPLGDLGHDNSLVGLSAVTSFTTELPKPRTAFRVGPGSITGTSLP